MTREAGRLLTALIAVVVFALVAFQTVGALHDSGAWAGAWKKHSFVPGPRPDDPFAPLDALLDHPLPPLGSGAVRDPFALGAAPAPATSHAPAARKPVAPAPEPKPILTAIVWDADPRALVHWQGRDWTIRSGGLFDEFQVQSITREQVTLSRGSETIVLQQRKPQGD